MGSVIACLLGDLAPEMQAAFYGWIEGMTLAEDWEDGAGFAEWLRLHAAVPGDAIWVFVDAIGGDIVGTASLVAQDRDLHAPPGGWVLGGVNVVRSRRGQRVGAAMMLWIDAELQKRAATSGQIVSVVLQAENPIAVRLYSAFGFAPYSNGTGIYGKTYRPL